jgi:hypothetical protein
LLSKVEERKRLMVPKVSISSVVIPLREECALVSIDVVGVSVLEDDVPEEEEPRRLNIRVNEMPLDLGHPDCWDGAAGVGVFCCGRTGGNGTERLRGEGGAEVDASLLVVLVIELGVVEPDADGSAESLLRFKDDATLVVLDVSADGSSTGNAAGDGGQEVMAVAVSAPGIGSSSPSSVTSTERRGSGRGAKRIFREGGGAAERCGERRMVEVLVGVADELRLLEDEEDDEEGCLDVDEDALCGYRPRWGPSEEECWETAVAMVGERCSDEDERERPRS